jgi:hypothetical protein
MTRILADESLRNKLYNLSEPLEICDDAGRVLGRYLPTIDPSRYEVLESPISKEELLRRKKSKGKTYTTAEVLRHLEKL